MKLQNITVLEYSQKKSVVKYDALLSALVATDNFCGNTFDLPSMSYHTVRDIEKKLRNGKTFTDLSLAFQKAFNVSDKQFFSASIVDFYGARNFLKKEFERLMNQEKSLLKSDGVDTTAWESAGGKSLEPFGEIMPLMKLGKIYSIYPFDLGSRPYNEIIALLVAHKRSEIVEKKYHEITKPKPTKK